MTDAPLIPAIYTPLKDRLQLCAWCDTPNAYIAGVSEGWEQNATHSTYYS
jgi:hypothetical protein